MQIHQSNPQIEELGNHQSYVQPQPPLLQPETAQVSPGGCVGGPQSSTDDGNTDAPQLHWCWLGLAERHIGVQSMICYVLSVTVAM